MQIWGTQPEDIDRAEDRDLWYDVLTRLDIKQPPGTMVTNESSALKASKELGYPVMVRPSFVLGGRAMEIVYRCSAILIRLIAQHETFCLESLALDLVLSHFFRVAEQLQ